MSWQVRQNKQTPPSSPSVLFRPQWISRSPPTRGKGIFTESKLISSENILTGASKNAAPAVWAPLHLVKLSHKISHHSPSLCQPETTARITLDHTQLPNKDTEVVVPPNMVKRAAMCQHTASFSRRGGRSLSDIYSSPCQHVI